MPAGVEATEKDRSVFVKGPKGTLSQKLHDTVSVALENGTMLVTVKNPTDKSDRALWGLFQRLLSNMVLGVTKGFEKKLELNGVGYKVSVLGAQLNLSLGFSHPVVFALPEGVSATVEKNVLTLQGIDKQLLGETAARIRALKKPEPYKGKGIKYVDEVIRRKAGKAAKAGAK